nr:Mur ligase family protein [Bacteroidales bacterium]
MKLLTSDIERITGGTLEGRGDLVVTSVTFDSRLVSLTEGNLFVAIRGKNHDGHSFIGQLYDSGLRCFLVEKDFNSAAKYDGASLIRVDNSIDALQLLASHVRRMFSSPVIAVTGSAGKTIVKEWLAEIAGYVMPVIRSPRSYNSQVGVPLSVLKLDNKYRLGIFEAGISRPGEMDKLRRIINPDIGIITNIGEAHSENFSDLHGKAREKLRLFRDSKVIIYCRDHNVIHDEILSDRNLAGKSLISWSYGDSNAAAIVAVFVRPDTGHSGININFRGSAYEFEVPFIDRASIENAVTVAVASLYLGIGSELISKGMKRLSPVAMRMNRKAGLNNCLIIEDYYNSDPGSLAIAVEYLAMQNKKKKTLILSDILQSGREEKELYGEVAELVSRTGVEKFIGIGEALSRNRSLFGQGARFFSSTDEFLRSPALSDFSNEAVLLKGARIFEFERIGVLLEEKVHQTVLEVNLDAVSSNLNEFRKYLNPGTGIMAMVKAFAYGAGPSEIASLLQYHRVDYL